MVLEFYSNGSGFHSVCSIISQQWDSHLLKIFNNTYISVIKKFFLIWRNKPAFRAFVSGLGLVNEVYKSKRPPSNKKKLKVSSEF